MVSEQDRINAIESSLDTGEKKSINYKGDRIPRPVKRIPLEYLLFNPHNGRIRSFTKSYESQFHELNPESEVDKKIIEQYLYDSAIGKNEKTLESLEQNGQQEVGIITRDGIIIDGNRRAMLLNILSKKKKEPGFFNAIVLPDKLKDNEKEIVTLETSYQMGVDSKVDYNPIEKYIRCKELKNKHKLTLEEIAHIMAEGVPRITEWLNILGIMDEYLFFLGTPEVYTRLEKREGHFVDLYNYLKAYKNRKPETVKWNYSSDDIEDLKQTYFTYIRLGIPVLRARVIAKPTASSSFFCHKDLWDIFLRDYKQAVDSYIEPSFNDVKNSSSYISNEDIIRDLDDQWKSELAKPLLENLSYSEVLLKDKLESIAPIKLLNRVISNLGQINSENLEGDSKNVVKGLLMQIRKRLDELDTMVIG